MTNNILDVSVIICAYTEERWNDLVAAVESIQQQSTPPREIIVVIDHNPYLFKRVRTDIVGIISIENSNLQGLSGARNSGLSIAKGARIAFLDDDAAAEPDWLVQLYHCCEDPQVLGAGGTVEPQWLSERPIWFPEEFYWVVGCTYQSLPDAPIVVRNPFGGCACYQREMFEAVGGFRDGIGRAGTRPMGGEETEICIRALQHWPQRVFLYHPQARIHHRISARRANWRYFQSRCYAEGLSKALVTRYVGVRDSLASERTYTFQTLPSGVLRNLKNSIVHRNLAGVQRAGAIVAGLFITTMGYLVGTFSQRVVLRKDVYSNKLDNSEHVLSHS